MESTYSRHSTHIQDILPCVRVSSRCFFSSEDPAYPSIDKYYQVLMDLVDLNLLVLDGKDPSALKKRIRKKMSGKNTLKRARNLYWLFSNI